MRKRLCSGIAMAAAAMSIISFAGGEDIAFKSISISTGTVRQYETVEINSVIDVSYKNPYDGEEISLAAGITGPDGRVIGVPAFYSGGDSLWKARFSPTKTGRYDWRLLLKSGPNRYASSVGHFEVLPGRGNGFLRNGKQNPYYPVFDSGRTFFGIGHNIAWIKDKDVSGYESYFALLNENGCNLTRIWVNSPWTFAVETKKIGEYNTADCDKVDAVLALAERYGIYIILSLDSYGALMDESGSWNEQWWDSNPYNKKTPSKLHSPAQPTLESESKSNPESLFPFHYS